MSTTTSFPPPSVHAAADATAATAPADANFSSLATTKDLSGVAWATAGGSLVGSLNPNNFGYRTSDGHGGYIITGSNKRYKRVRRDADGHILQDNDCMDDVDDIPGNIVVQFRDMEGVPVGQAMDVPTNAGGDELGLLIHSLLNNNVNDDTIDDENDKQSMTIIPYAFFAKVTKTIQFTNVSTGLKEARTSTEEIDITDYTSLASFLHQYNQHVSTEQTLELIYRPMALFKVRPVTRCTDTLPGHTDAILHVSYSPDGQQLASGGGDATVRFWDVHTSTPRHTCHGHKDHVLCTAWSPDGKKFASGDKRGNLMIWDPTMKGGSVALGSIKAHSKWITGLAWEPMHSSSREGTCERLVTSSKDSLAKIWNVRTKRCEATLAGHLDSIESVKWGGEGFIYTASRDRTIKVWNASDCAEKGHRVGTLVRTLVGHGHRVNALAVSCDFVCRTGPYDHYGKITNMDVNIIKDKDSEEWHETAYMASVAKYKAFKGTEEPERLISGSDDFTLLMWHPTEGKQPIKRLTGHQQAVNHIAFSPDARFFASASFDKKVKVWNGRSGDFVSTLTGHVGAVYQVAWSSDGRYLVSASKDSTAKLWEIPSGKKAKETLPGHEDEVYALDWSPNGSSVATGSKDRKIKIWKH
jgi:ribosome assembly protein 4